MDDGRTLGCLPHNQRGCSGQFVSRSNLGNAQGVIEQVGLTAKIDQAGQAGKPDGNADRALPPGAAMRIDDQYAQADPTVFFLVR